MKIVSTDQAPSAIGPYSQAVVTGNLVFCSGQIPLMANGTLLEGGVDLQTKQVMSNLAAVLAAAGTDFTKVVKTTIFLSDMGDFAAVNEVYASYFGGESKPARATVEVSCLPKNVAVEIECIAEI